MHSTQIDQAVSTRARVRIGERNGYHKGVEGIAMGFRSAYESIKVGFVDETGEYTGESTTVYFKHVELIEDEPSGEEAPVSGIARIAADLDVLNREVEASLREREIITDPNGVKWYEGWDGIFRNGYGSAAPRALLKTR